MYKKIIIHHNQKPETLKIKKKLETLIRKTDCEIVREEAEIVIVLGGDGTMLSAVTRYHPLNIPFLGIDLGTLGFLNTINPDKLHEVLHVLDGEKIRIERYPLLAVKTRTVRGHEFTKYAFNEVLLKHLEPRLMEANVCFNSRPFNYFTGDGFIISTPMGATGYAIWAGGAVVHSDLHVFQITPLTPNDNSVNRPMSSSMIVPKDTVIEIKVINAHKRKVIASCDGRNVTHEYIEGIHVTMAEECVQIIRLDHFNYFDLFKRKILDKNIRRYIGENERKA